MQPLSNLISSVSRDTQIPLERLIHSNPLIVQPDMPLTLVIEQMALAARQPLQERCGNHTSGTNAAQVLPGIAFVVKDGKLQGVFSERDLVRLVASQGKLEHTTVAEVMSPVAVTLRLEDAQNISAVLEQFHQHQLDYLPVVNDQYHLIGVIAHPSIVQALSLVIQQLEHAQILLHQREQEFRTLVENSPDVIARYDSELRHLYINPAIVHEAERPAKDFIGKTCADLGFSAEISTQWENGLRQVFVSEEMNWMEFSYENSKGKQFYQVRMIPEFNLEGKIESVLSILRNISDEKIIEHALRESETRLRLAFEVAGMGAWDWNPNTGEEILSPEAEALYGFAPGTFDGRIETLLERVHPDEREMICDLSSQALQTKIDTKEFRVILPDSTVRWIVSRGKIFCNEQGQPVRVIGVDFDITDRKLADEAIHENQQKLIALMSNLPGIAYSCCNDTQWTVNFLSAGCFELTGYRPETLINNASLCYGDLIHPGDRQAVWDTVQAAIACKQPFELMYRIITATAEEKWVWEQGSGVFSEAGTLLSLEGFITDISQRKLAEERLKESLQEKEVLLREIHHRVKNNLQMVSSLLNLQAGVVTNPQVLAALEESQKRVEAMALIHQKLYLSDNLAKINFGEYAHSLIQDLFQSYVHPQANLSLRLALADIELPIDAAMAGGLIINELFSNAIKYAFPDNRYGEISVTFADIPSGGYVLTIADNGVGVPQGVDFRTTRSLGLRLVDALVRKLRGSIKLSRLQGTSIQITFNLPC